MEVVSNLKTSALRVALGLRGAVEWMISGFIQPVVSIGDYTFGTSPLEFEFPSMVSGGRQPAVPVDRAIIQVHSLDPGGIRVSVVNLQTAGTMLTWLDPPGTALIASTPCGINSTSRVIPQSRVFRGSTAVALPVVPTAVEWAAPAAAVLTEAVVYYVPPGFILSFANDAVNQNLAMVALIRAYSTQGQAP